MKILFDPTTLRDTLRTLLVRFPIEILLSVILTNIGVVTIISESHAPWIPHTIYALIVTFFLSIGMTLVRERIGRPRLEAVLALLPILYGVGFYFVGSYYGDGSIEEPVFFLLHLVGFAAFVLIAPYWDRLRKTDSIEYSNYFVRVAWTKLMTGIVGLSVLLLGFIAIGSITYLFDLEKLFPHADLEKSYGVWAVISLALIAPIYALAHFPQTRDLPTEHYETNRFFSFLVRFVGIPFILLYFTILYAYSVRVLLHFSEWPKGIVSWLVIGFSTFGYLVYIFSRAYAEGNTTISRFRRYFPLSVLPQTIMLFYAIYLRIAQYDLTMERYFVVIFGVWLVLVSLHFTLSQKKTIAFIPLSLTIISLLFSAGPWSVFSLPLDRQHDRFVTKITEARILRDGVIVPVPADKPLPTKLNNEIADGVDYLCREHDCKRLRPLFTRALDEAQKEAMTREGSSYDGLASYAQAEAIKKAMNVSYRYESEDISRKYVTLSVPYEKRSDEAIDVRGYETFFNNIGAKYGPDTQSGQSVTIDPDTQTLRYSDGVTTESVSIGAFTDGLRERFGSADSSSLSAEDLTYTIASDRHEFRLVFSSYAYPNPRHDGSQKETWYNISGYVLVRAKTK